VNSSEFEIRITSDGSPTVFAKNFNATYHSMHGALQESEHVFIKNGLEIAKTKFNPIRILEIGFGTGLNALLTLTKTDRPVHYTSIEAFPLPEATYHQLDFGFNKEQFLKMHNAEWEKEIELTNDFILCKLKGDIRTIDLDKNFDLVYFDAFAPSSQDELWQKDTLKKMYNCMSPGAILVTFCAKGDFKRTLKSLGFSVEFPKGALRKREMTRAAKPF